MTPAKKILSLGAFAGLFTLIAALIVGWGDVIRFVAIGVGVCCGLGWWWIQHGEDVREAADSFKKPD